MADLQVSLWVCSERVVLVWGQQWTSQLVVQGDAIERAVHLSSGYPKYSEVLGAIGPH